MNIVISPYLHKKNPDFATLYPKVIEGLRLSSFSRGANFEKLNVGTGENALFSIRLNHKSRLILTRFKDGENASWVLLDELVNHNYENCPFLNPNYLKQYLQGQMRIKFEEEIASTISCGQESVTELEFFNHQFIALNPHQSETLNMPLPLVVQGMPGSGKSCVALSMMKQCTETPDHHILYVTSSKDLVMSMQKTWDGTPGVETARVEFKTYAEVFEDNYGEIHSANISDFAQWLKQNPKITQGLDQRLAHDLLVYQEFRMMSGFELSAFQTLSKRQRLFAPEKYLELFPALAGYIAYLRQIGKVDVSLVPLHHTGAYTHIFVDEAQDFSSLQLLNLKALATDLKIVYFLDSNQSLHDNFSKLPLLKRILDKHFHTVELPYTFRCSKAVISLANDTLKLKHYVSGGILDKDTATTIRPHRDAEAGAVVWQDKVDTSLVELTHSMRTAVICDPADIKAARKQFPQAVVMTVAQSKGLEYDIVIAYYLLERCIDKKINQLVAAYHPEREKMHRPKEGEAHHEYGPSLNQLFTAFTRAQSRVYILYKPDSHAIGHVLNVLMPQAPGAPELLSPVVKSTREEILVEIKRQYEAGNLEVAKNLYLSNNIGELADFTQLFKPRMVLEEKKEPGCLVLPEQTKGIKHQTKEKKPGKTKSPKSKASQAKDIQYKEYHVMLQERLNSLTAANQFFSNMLMMFGQSISLATAVKKYPDICYQPIADFLNSNGLMLWSKTEEGKKLLWIMLYANPNLTLKIQAQSLYRIRKGLSVIDILSLDSLGCRILLKLIETNLSLIDAFTIDSLCRVIPEGLEFDFEENSMLYWLTRCSEGQMVLEQLFNHQDFVRYMRADGLCYMALHQDKSALFYLSRTKFGCKILYQLFSNNASLLKYITAEALYTVLSVNDTEDAHTSVFYFLSRYEDGREIIELLYKENPWLFQKIDLDVFNALLPASAGKYENTSVLYFLSSTKIGLDFLKMLFGQYPYLMRCFTPSLLNSMRSLDSIAYQNASVLYWLSVRGPAFQLFQKVMEYNPELMESIRPDALYSFLPAAAAENSDSSAFYWLCEFEKGIDFLDKLFKLKPSLVQDLSVDALYRLRTQISYDAENTSPFYYLSSSENGRLLLLDLYTQNPALIEGVSADLLCRLLPESADNLANTSVLYWLSEHKIGIKLLSLIFSKNPHVLREITTYALYCLMPPAAKEYENTSTLYNLAQHKEGCQILLNLFAQNPKLIQEMSSDALCCIMTSSNAQYENASALYWLSGTEEGCELLLQLFEQNPELMRRIRLADLHRQCPAKDRDLHQTVLEGLMLSIQGRSVIALLLKQNHEWIRTINDMYSEAIFRDHPDLKLALEPIKRKAKLRFFPPHEAKSPDLPVSQQDYPQNL